MGEIDGPGIRSARLSKDGDRVQCGSCGAQLAGVDRFASEPERVNALELPNGWGKDPDGIWTPSPGAERTYRVLRLLASEVGGLPPRFGEGARAALKPTDPARFAPVVVHASTLPIHVRCPRCHAENEVSRNQL